MNAEKADLVLKMLQNLLFPRNLRPINLFLTSSYGLFTGGPDSWVLLW